MEDANQHFEFEDCPHCTRRFFKGKLCYHLKLCNKLNPMLRQPLRKKLKKVVNIDVDNNQVNLSPKSKYQRCPECQTKMPMFLYRTHIIKCRKKAQLQKQKEQRYLNKINSKLIQKEKDFGIGIEKIREFSEEQKLTIIDNNPQRKQSDAQLVLHSKESKAGINVKEQQRLFPKVNNSLKKSFHRKIANLSQASHYSIKIRKQLSCFRKACQIQQIPCSSCGRRFSKEASLRHIPICQNIRSEQFKRMISGKRSSLLNKNPKQVWHKSKEETPTNRQNEMKMCYSQAYTVKNAHGKNRMSIEKHLDHKLTEELKEEKYELPKKESKQIEDHFPEQTKSIVQENEDLEEQQNEFLHIQAMI